MPKQNALQKIESHEKLCRIMQKLTHTKIHAIEDRVKRLEEASNEYITVDTNNSSELLTLGNSTTNPNTLILGGGNGD